MRLERLTYNKIKFFLTSDDLYDRGLSKDDIWKDSLKWHQLFHDMLEEANEEFGVEIQGTIAVEIFSLQAQGMVMIVTMEELDEEEESLNDVFIEMQVTVEGSEEILFEFSSIEEVIQLSKRFASMNVSGGSLYSMNSKYYLLFEGVESDDKNKTISVLAEYGDPSLLSIHRLIEYGKQIIKDNTIETIVTFF
ncbi:MAG: adaptor protein [Bacillus sp. (in: firmicutes)]|jgi:adapter protein MecA 1/2|uniref:genetic competence negative regulator n=1 Tax=Bacillus sp. 1NLA3E TaxID=666686 RepID=UPI000247E329|nr:genetic competence negative regulator [Bacillus sp. 1NLA3E]AGK54731.1 adaptor protein [Bacillus sp. 1NLA3E]MDF2903882.1 adaptor protein [Bacillus sp. (in: firmicutes)]